MQIFYSPSTKGFYNDALHGLAIPEDAIPVTAEEHATLLEAEASGKFINVNGGRVVANDVSPPKTWDEIRGARNLRLRQSDWTQLPDATLTPAEKAQWTAYRKSLRDITADFPGPDNVVWPTPPE